MNAYSELDKLANPISSDPYSQLQQVVDQNPTDVASATMKAQDPSSSKYNGYCQGFVDDVLNTPTQNRAPSASAAWANYQSAGQAVQGTQGIQPGDLLYFQDPNDPNGHVGIYSGPGKFISATEEDPQHPVQNHTLKGWQDKTGQQILGYVKNPASLPQIGRLNGIQ